MCKKVKKPAFAVVAIALFFASASPVFAGGIALTGTIPPAPVAPASPMFPTPASPMFPTPTGRGIPLTGTNGTATGITGQALTGTRPKTVNISVPGTGKSIPLSGTISGSSSTGVIVGVNLFTVKFP